MNMASFAYFTWASLKNLIAKTPAFIKREESEMSRPNGHLDPGVSLTNGVTNGHGKHTNGTQKRKASTGKSYAAESSDDDVPLV